VWSRERDCLSDSKRLSNSLSTFCASFFSLIREGGTQPRTGEFNNKKHRRVGDNDICNGIATQTTTTTTNTVVVAVAVVVIVIVVVVVVVVVI